MANCNKLLMDFVDEISLTETQLNRLYSSQSALRARIDLGLKEVAIGNYHYAILGSFELGTIIRKNDSTYDVDLGLIIDSTPDVLPVTLQGYVLNAVINHTSTVPIHKKKCVRVVYAGEYHVDITIYCKTSNGQKLATKDNWEDSDPGGFSAWFNSKGADRAEHEQLCRIIKTLKSWCSRLDFKTPSGLALTVWASQHFVYNDRDDFALAHLLGKMSIALTASLQCYMPVIPYDNLTLKLDAKQKEKFINALACFATDAEAAVGEDNQLRASTLWRKHLGDRFQLGHDRNVDEVADRLMEIVNAAKGSTAFLDKTGTIRFNPGKGLVKHQQHRNYGE